MDPFKEPEKRDPICRETDPNLDLDFGLRGFLAGLLAFRGFRRAVRRYIRGYWVLVIGALRVLGFRV